jgi:AmmeMemoRadiSam system protein A
MCHAPIVIPEVGGSRGEACAETTRAMEQVAERLVSHNPDVMVVLSPHTPRLRQAFAALAQPVLRGDLGDFGAPQVRVELPIDAGALETLLACAEREGASAAPVELERIDHGAMVPLTFVCRAGWRGPTLLLAFPMRDDPRALAAMGRAIAAAARERGESWAILASGDMSHRLIEGAPAGFHPDAHRFDDAFCERVADNDLAGAVAVDAGLRDVAAEDVVESVDVARAALAEPGEGHRVYSYEGPFGVGYLVAMLHDPPRDGVSEDGGEARGDDDRVMIEMARDAVTAVTLGREYTPPKLTGPLSEPHGVFVTLFSPGRRLRGCIGRMEPLQEDMARELADCAVSAATRDPRFDTVRPDELDSLSYEVSLLAPKEPIDSVDELDPSRYGVVVRAGLRQAVLLPHIDGIDTAEQQLVAVLQKGGIRPNEPFEMWRFAARKITEG